LQRDVVGLTSLIASSARTRGRSASASSGVPQRDANRGSSRSPLRPHPDSAEHSREGAIPLSGVLTNPAERSPRPRSPMIPIAHASGGGYSSATLDPNWRGTNSVGGTESVVGIVRLPPVMSDASIQCTLVTSSASQGANGTSENGSLAHGPRLSTTGMTPEEIARSFDLPTLCAEADRLIKAIQILREERTPIKQKAMPSPSSATGANGPSPSSAAAGTGAGAMTTPRPLSQPQATVASASGTNGTSDRKLSATPSNTAPAGVTPLRSGGLSPRKT
jgi:hypothetical protein